MRDDEIIEVEVDEFLFQGRAYQFLKVALNHINYDKGNHKRSDFSIEEVVDMVISTIEGSFLEPVGTKNGYDFFVHFFMHREKSYKLIFEIGEGTLYIRVITLFRQNIKKGE